MSRTPDTHSNPLARLFSRFFDRDEPAPASASAPQEITPRVVTAAPAATPVTPPSAVAPTPSARQRTYTVQQGDSLSKIALRLYGDVNRWTLLFDANRGRINDPERLHAGQVLMVPDAPLH